MTTQFGRFCKVLRVQLDETVAEMASRLGVSKSYLSAVENDKRPIPDTWGTRIADLYCLDAEETDALCESIMLSQQKVVLTLTGKPSYIRATASAFAEQLDTIDLKTAAKLYEILAPNKTLCDQGKKKK